MMVQRRAAATCHSRAEPAPDLIGGGNPETRRPSRARADLSETAADRIKVYEKLADALAAMQQSLERQTLAGRATQVQVDQGKLTSLNARIDLERLRLGQAPTQP